MDNDTFDVAIVGGGIIGSAIAYFLGAEPAFTGSVAVVERDPTYAEASTPRSAGAIRQQFSTPENINISSYGVEFLKNIDEHLSVNGEAPDIGFIEGGFLFLASPEGLAVLEQNHAIQRRHGADVVLLSPTQLEERFSWLGTEGLAAGSLGLSGEGWFDPFTVLQAFRRKARDLGAVYLEDEVVNVKRHGNRATGLVLKDKGEIACGTVVDAAGPRAAAIAAMAGLELPVRPRKRLVFVFDCRQDIEGCPLVIDPSGLWFRPESGGFICGISPPADQDPDCLDFEIDYGLFEETLWPLLARRVPAFEAIKRTRAWAGHYAYNTLDQNAILGPHPDVPNFLFANGFSGHGVQQSPAVGRAIAEIIAFGTWRSLDLERLSYGRVVRGEPLREVNVV
ncbi:MAG: FAD-binding oxidoreductase [Rhodospirillales bacterium]|nr:FAD-binding oxidoreductase [Rhodospirillales bacterium]MDP6773730.1 FAD-binding oxidoreductase [Rhodospirillales bacterium]